MSELTLTAENPFSQQNEINQVPRNGSAETAITVEQSRAIQEVQASMVIAKQFPRDEFQAMEKIKRACTRPSLADASMYAYPRGSEVVTGPSIRLAEAVAQNWGNMQFGIRELSQQNGESTVEAFAWDIETNTRQVKIFQVPHIRYSRKYGNKQLTDPRDIYEMVANQGARRLRACILGVIPGDVIDTAVKQCEMTLTHKEGAPKEQIKNLVETFAKMGVTQEMIVKRLGHNLDSVIGAEILQLRKIYTSLRDGMAKVDDFFEPPQGKPVESSEQTEALNDALKAGKKEKKQLASKATKDSPEKKKTGEILNQALEDIKNAKSQEDIDTVIDFARDLPTEDFEAIVNMATDKSKQFEN